MAKKKMNTTSLEKVIDKHISTIGTKKRDQFEEELRLDVLGYKIKQLRLDKNLTQEQLGQLVGVKKSQISKIENSFTNARFETILRIFRALDARLKFTIEQLN